jgi:hypothetical protein
MDENDVDEVGKRFLVELCEQTQGDTAAQVSMSQIGTAISLEKEAAVRSAEGLIGWGLVEIRTLSGGIGITAEGVEAARNFGARGYGLEERPALGEAPVLDEIASQAVTDLAEALKKEVGGLGLSYDTLAEVMADFKTIDAQLGSSRPKTAIVRECFRSMIGALEKVGSDGNVAKIRSFLRE